MSKSLGQVINNIMKENSSKKALLLTDTMYIVGTIHDYMNCDNCHDCLVSLKNVKISKLDDMCNCHNSECDCILDPFLEYEWFNINTNSIIGFSII